MQDVRMGRRRADPELIEETLEADNDHEIKAVLATHNETATGVTSDIGRRAQARWTPPSHPALLFVDGVSARSARIDFRMDEWGVDVMRVAARRRASCCRPACG